MKTFKNLRYRLAITLAAAIAVPTILSSCGGGSSDSSSETNTRPQTMDGLTLELEDNTITLEFIRSAASVADPTLVESGAVNYSANNRVKFYRPKTVADFTTVGFTEDPAIAAGEVVPASNGGLDVTWPSRVESATYTYQPTGPSSGRLTITTVNGLYLFTGADAGERAGLGSSDIQLYYFSRGIPRDTIFDLTFNSDNGNINNIIAEISPATSTSAIVTNNPANRLSPYRLNTTANGQLDIVAQADIRQTETNTQVPNNYTLTRDLNEPSAIATPSIDGHNITLNNSNISFSFTQTGSTTDSSSGSLAAVEIGNVTQRTPGFFTDSFTTTDAGTYSYRLVTGTDSAILTFDATGQIYTLNYTSSATDSSQAAGSYTIRFSNGTTTISDQFVVNNPELNL